MPRILTPNHSFQRRGSFNSSRTSLAGQPPLRRGSLTTTIHQKAAYESAFSLRCQGSLRRQTVDSSDGKVHRTSQNAVWELQGPPSQTALSKDSVHPTESTSSQFSSNSTLPSTNRASFTGLAVVMQQKVAGAPNSRSSISQSAPCSPNSVSSLTSSFYAYSRIEKTDSWGQFIDVQSKDEDLDRRIRVMRRYHGAPHSMPHPPL